MTKKFAIWKLTEVDNELKVINMKIDRSWQWVKSYQYEN